MHVRELRSVQRVQRAQRRTYLESVRTQRADWDARRDARRDLDEILRASARVAALRTARDPGRASLVGLSPTERFVLVSEELFDGVRRNKLTATAVDRVNAVITLAFQLTIAKAQGLSAADPRVFSRLFNGGPEIQHALEATARARTVAELRKSARALIRVTGGDALTSDNTSDDLTSEVPREAPETRIRTGEPWMELQATGFAPTELDSSWAKLQWLALAASVASMTYLSLGLALPIVAGAYGSLGTPAGVAMLAFRGGLIAAEAQSALSAAENLRQYGLTGEAKDADLFGGLSPALGWLQTCATTAAVFESLSGAFPTRVLVKGLGLLNSRATALSAGKAMARFRYGVKGLRGGSRLFNTEALVYKTAFAGLPPALRSAGKFIGTGSSTLRLTAVLNKNSADWSNEDKTTLYATPRDWLQYSSHLRALKNQLDRVQFLEDFVLKQVKAPEQTFARPTMVEEL